MKARASKYEAIARDLSSLPVDGCIELCNFITDNHTMTNLLTGIRHTSIGKYLIISWRINPSGGVRLIRLGSHGSLWNSIPETRSTKNHPQLHTLFKKYETSGGLKPGGFYLGFMNNTPSIDYPIMPRCIEKGCAYPANGDSGGLCRHHFDFFKGWEQIDRNIDHLDIWNKKIDEQSGNWPYFTTGWLSEDKTNWLNVGYERMGHRVYNSKSEIENDKWIQENVIQRGLNDTGIVLPRRVKEKEELLETASIKHSVDSIWSFLGCSQRYEDSEPIDVPDRFSWE